MRNTGPALTIAGGTVVGTGTLLLANYIYKDINDDVPDTSGTPYTIYSAMIVCGLVTTVAGITLWITGDNKTSRAEFTLKKFDIKTENSMAVGLQLTLRF